MEKTKVVVTGGPSGGKTTFIEALRKDMGAQVSVVPEAASILYRGGFPRKSTPSGKKHAQRAICFVQRELEELVTAESKSRLIICDRGSLDSIAYWPGSEDEFFSSLQTDRVRELHRYDWVLHLDTADADHFDTSNPVRIESHKEALELNQMVRIAWQGHPRRLVIGHSKDFLEKMSKAKRAIELILEGQDFNSVQSFLSN